MATPAELAEAPHAEPGETVLVVDDEPTLRELVSEVLKDLGYITIEAADGAAGLKVLQSETHIDLLISDVGPARRYGWVSDGRNCARKSSGSEGAVHDRL